jgi:NAD+ diphosphatase
MTDTPMFFCDPGFDRNAALRRDAQALDAAWSSAQARFIAVWQARPLLRAGRAARLTRTDLGALLPALQRAIYLGDEAGAPLFAVALEADAEPAALGRFAGLRDLVSEVPAADAALLAYARAMVNWHRHHRYCGVCGAPNRAGEAGFVMACTGGACGHRSFPRLDPAIIVLVHRDDRCLLGRQPGWPSDRFSTLAGFVEPGEALEDAVRREVAEEAGIAVGPCHYRASQPWPFPASLMIGFHAMATSESIRTHDGELAEARWFTRAEIAAGDVVLPPRTSVAFALIAAWFDAVPGPGLARLHRDGEFLRRPDQPPEAR